MIRLIVTGGTIDKAYNELDGSLWFPGSHVADMLKQSRCRLSIEVQQLMLKDSLDMTSDDRDLINSACQLAEEKRIVITHGTDTMVDTARVLAQGEHLKTIVVMGAMIPFTIGYSDALFNLGAALTVVQMLPDGVYIAMNGSVFAWDEVVKDKQRGEFLWQSKR
ncbi:MAG: asparaginase domain-containing protein [Methylococcaceae bacterium]